MTSSRKRSASDLLFNLLALVMLALAVLAIIFLSVVFISPSLAPFGAKTEPTRVALLSTPTPKPTVAVTIPAPPTWTPEPTRTPLPTPTSPPPRASRTPRPTVFFTPRPTDTATPEPTVHPYPFKLVDEGVVFQSYPFSSSCDWLGIAGEVVDKEGNPVIGIPVVLNGGGLQNIVTNSGSRTDYAPSGWEHFLDSKLKEGDFTIQLYRVINNQARPISEVVPIHTRKDCRANLAYVVFELAWEDYPLP